MTSMADVSAVARRMYDEHGARAVAEAAQRAASCDNAGDAGQARTWRRVQAVLEQMRGPRQT